ncbi:hypothetical protein N431DRAFT_326010 [Stipitochalara longipes BDJ]|nr:hypothetical protein N431DRAFT_326010 [Stipitochalara longipes BDJ]
MGSSIIPSDAPPDYDTLLNSPSLRRRFNIQPREDEGREVLPPYSSAISLRAVFQRKMELEGAVHRAQNRNWARVYVTLQGTALTFHKCKIPGILGTKGRTTPDFPAGTTKGAFLQSYNLQHADVGIAADYVKKRFVIRVRAEADQFLLSCHKIETFVLWLQSLFAAIDLAPPLDDREIPRDLSVPRRSRRRVRVEAAADGQGRNADLVRQQEEILQSQFPALAAASDGSGEGEGSDSQSLAASDSRSLAPSDSIPEEPELESPVQSSLDVSSVPTPRPTTSAGPASASRSSNLIARARQAIQSTTHLSQYAPHSSVPNPSISADGKWKPTHHWSHFYDMMYAKRCMAILTHRSPRKSNLVIMKGKQWIVDWATGALTRCEPPDYGELLAAAARENAGVRATGQALRA